MTVRRGIGGVLLVLVGVSLVTMPSFADAYSLQVMYRVLQLVAIAQAWNLMAGYGGLVSLAPGAFIGVGSYAAAKLSISAGFGIVPSILAAGVIALIFGLLVSVPMFRFRGLYFTIASLVLAAALQIFMTNWNGLGGGTGLALTNIAPTPEQLYFYALALAVGATVAIAFLVKTPFGMGLMAMRDNEDVAQEVGILTFRTKLLAWLLGSLIFGLVGGLQAQKLSVIEPGGAFTLQWTIDIILTVIIGGLGTIIGPIIGAFTVVGLSEQLADYPELHLAIIGAIAVIVIRVAPFGIWGAIKRYVGPQLEKIAALRSPDRTPTRHQAVASDERSPPGAPRGKADSGEAQVGSESPGAALLSVSGVNKYFGGVQALTDVDLELRTGEVLGVIGPNGAGKSTLIGVLNGAHSPDAGTITLSGNDITRVPAARRARLGIGRASQIPRPFEHLTVLDNLLVARFFGGGDTSRSSAHESSFAILERTGLYSQVATPASDLTLLELKRLELARALALSPRVLLLDEIGAGLVPSEVTELISLINDLRGEVESILVVEHVLEMIRETCDRAVVFNQGAVLTEGTPAEVFDKPEVISVYLGTGYGEERTIKEPAPDRTDSSPLLTLNNVSGGYGSHRALEGVELTVNRGEVVGILGVNGAGKTTLARAISGMLPTINGEIGFEDADIAGAPSHRIARSGLAHCMEGRQIFADLTVEENLLISADNAPRAERAERLADAYELFDILEEKRDDSGASLSGGQQQMLAIARTLMARPTLAIFDEISLGLAPVAVDRLYDALSTLNSRGVTLIVIEQDVERGLALADRVYVLEKGRVGLSGTPSEIRDNPLLKSLYVGEAAEI